MVRSPHLRPAIVLLGSLAIAATTALGAAAAAAPECSYTEIGIDCGATGTSTTGVATTLRPYRYLATADDPTLGECWYWSRYPPGLDTWDPYNDPAVLTTRWLLPECPDGGSTTVSASGVAWTVFRSFLLDRPIVDLRPDVGITNLPTLLDVERPTPLAHSETLPDGRVLRVVASVEAVRIDWGDGTPKARYPAATAFADGAAHGYTIKTCPKSYRADDPSGWRCHPTLSAYPITVTFDWAGRYRAGGSWTRLGILERAATVFHDVDEVVGVLVSP